MEKKPLSGDENVAIGGRPGVGTLYDDRLVSDRPLSDDYLVEQPIKARMPKPATVPVEQLPMLGVAQATVGTEIRRLRAVEAAIERELSSASVFGANGQLVPYLAQRAAENRAELEHVRAEIERLNNLDDSQVRARAYELGAR